MIGRQRRYDTKGSACHAAGLYKYNCVSSDKGHSLDSGFHSASAPLVFIKPVGFSTADSLRLMQAAQRLDETVRWRLAPAGVQADVYLAHRASVVYGPVTTPSPLQPLEPDIPSKQAYNSTSVDSINGAYEHSRLRLDSKGMYRSQPVCLLGAQLGALALEGRHHLPALQFPGALEELRVGLQQIANDLFILRAMYALGRCAWLERARWKTHRLHVIDGSLLIAAIETKHWRVHLLNNVPVELIEAGNVILAPQSSIFGAPGFTTLPLEQALWEFAKRCPEPLLAQVLPSVYLRKQLTHRRHNELSKRELGDHCVAILGALDTQSRTAQELQDGLRLSRPALLRALACLALTRSIRTEQKSMGLRHWLRWLPARVHQQVFGPSSLQ
jgi:hypothetical protein